MTLKKYLCSLIVLASSLGVYGQPKGGGGQPVQIRAILHSPKKPEAILFYKNKVGEILPLELLPLDLCRPVMTHAANGSLVFYDKLVLDPIRPEQNIAATCKIPVGAKRGIIIILPNTDGSSPLFRMMFIDDSAAAFPKGESKVITLIPTETAVEVGEHKLAILPGKIVRIPPIRKVDEFNMAQTNFYYKQNDSWKVFTERQLQYLDGFRRVFIVYASPGVPKPLVFSIVDTATP